jgi:hypothetical protein
MILHLFNDRNFEALEHNTQDRGQMVVLRTYWGIALHLPIPVSLPTLLQLAFWLTCVACLSNGQPPGWAIPRIDIPYIPQLAIRSNNENDCLTLLVWVDPCVFNDCISLAWLGMATTYSTTPLHTSSAAVFLMWCYA